VRQDDLEAASDRRALAEVLAARGRTREAQETLTEVVAVLERILGPEHYEISPALDKLAELAERRRDRALAITLYERSLAIKTRVLGSHHNDVHRTARALARLRP
jgi:tetratricopeptide (TPR) repeat protein